MTDLVRALSMGVLLLLALGAVACGPPAPAYPITDAERALRLYGSLRARARSMRAEADVDYFDDRGRVHLDAMMLMERPDRVRFDATTSFGSTGAILTSDGRHFALLDLRDNRFLRGQPCARNIARLIGVPLAANDVATLMLGGAPIIAHHSASIRWDSSGYYVVTLRGDHGAVQIVHLALRAGDHTLAPEGQRTRLLMSEVRSGRRLVFRATFDDWRIVDGVAMAFRIRFEEPRTETDALLRFSRIELNPELPGYAFSQRAPGGVRIQDVTCD